MIGRMNAGVGTTSSGASGIWTKPRAATKSRARAISPE